MQIRIDKAGMLSTVQDLGRPGYLSQGVPVSGAMDRLSARIANQALGNDMHAAVIEFAYGGAVFRAERDLLIAYSGEGALLEADSRHLPSDRPIFVPKGTEIRLMDTSKGCHTYLAIAGGWDVPEVLESRSTYLPAGIGGVQGRALCKGDVLKAADTPSARTRQLFNRLISDAINYPNWGIARWLLLPADRRVVRIVPAQEFTWFEGQSVVDFLSAPFRITPQSNRMGYRLEGPPMRSRTKRELLSTAVVPGTVQVTGDGKLILLMADSQTTGGYPRIAQIAAVDMPLCAQFKPGDEIFFREISRNDAEKLYLHQEERLKKLSLAWGMDERMNL
ncbi:biotin-dependent carboxyltransferase family protein [Parapedobacter indicus]|uniref:Antagonist of KipI n=1 Tax=Parapedobacter indicus TaxID=1477437 RepID=A0A1I3QRA5_9SPHI|nr:biotin-dependent carboxyltransferase family protein [Parapedobacter indicus]PPL00192.1 antagonist of KipI [Parapedobacter indicus]SFJ35811.1 antagonist of KipI [Parapedobacter indicus]